MKMKSDKEMCCYPLDVSLWNEKTHVWKDKLFLVDEVMQIMHMPINMGIVINRMFKKIENADAMPEIKDFLMLAYDPTPWKSEIHMTVTKDVPDGNMLTLSGTFISKVFDGPYHQVPVWIKEMDTYLTSIDSQALKYYFHYAYCPKCMKKFGHNYCVAFAQIK